MIHRVFSQETRHISMSASLMQVPLQGRQEGDFEYGINEQAVKNAYFYFYDADGVFVTQGDVWGRVATPQRLPLPKTLNLRVTMSLC